MIRLSLEPGVLAAEAHGSLCDLSLTNYTNTGLDGQELHFKGVKEYTTS